MKYITVTEIYESSDAEKIWELDWHDAPIVLDWLRDQGLEPEEVIEGYADEYTPMEDVPRGHIRFESGFQYNVVDQDLLGGTGDGSAEQKFYKDTGYGFRLV